MSALVETNSPPRPRLGFLGVGWIGRHRMQALVNSGLIEVAAIADPSPEMAQAARETAPEASLAPDFEALLAADLDGVVIATPSALHAEQTIRALERGLAVFCQKPLGRSAQEVGAVVAAAAKADRLLGVDLSYRHTAGMAALQPLIAQGALGDVFGVDLVFHNAYGPDKPWFYDKAQSGGGCVMDLGVHLVDLALWALDFPKVADVTSRLLAKGRPAADHQVEDYGIATLTLETGTLVRLACSWGLHAGAPAVIEASFYGTQGGASFRNVDGSFYDFVARRHDGTQGQILTQPPDDWGGQAALQWARQLAGSPKFDPEAWRHLDVALVLDRIYGRVGS